MTSNDRFRERVSYDANGNILKYLRAGGGFPSIMDSLNYRYYAGTNRLRGVRDSVPAANYGNNGFDIIRDLDNQPVTDNYVYDEIGNMIKDTSEKITSIKWSVYGKILEINRVATTFNNTVKIKYTYDAQGNRISKAVSKDGTDVKDYTWYVRDAQGNLLTTYIASSNNTDARLDSASLNVRERYLYGSSRLGMYIFEEQVDGGLANSGPMDRLAFYPGTGFFRGWKQYEFSNHLGNVLTTISDKKNAVASSTDGSLIGYFNPDIISGQDYYPFGMVMRVQKATNGKEYRYGFNGKETDHEVKDWGNEQDYGMRIYDNRLGRFLSVDPLTNGYPMLTPYQFSSNSPIANVDWDGAESRPAGKDNTGNEKEGDSKSTSETSYGSLHNQPITKREVWYWHAGGLTNAINGKKTESGWYTSGEYVELLSGASATKALAKNLKLFNSSAENMWNPGEVAQAELSRFVGNGLNNNAASHLLAAAKTAADGTNDKMGGRIAPSAVNVEDLLGLGLLLKEGFSLLSKTATTSRLVGFGSDEAIINNTANLIPKKGWYDVVVHGTEDGLNFTIGKELVSPSALYNKILTEGYKQGTKIRLLSCYSGSIEGGAAAQLSKLANAPVMAPQSYMFVSQGMGLWPKGKLVVGDGKWFTMFK